jgi:hypothetical protein
MTEGSLSSGSVLLSLLDVMILTEVWYEIVHWRCWWWSEGRHESVTERTFGILNVLLSIFDLVIFSKIWHEVVLWWGWWCLE